MKNIPSTFNIGLCIIMTLVLMSCNTPSEPTDTPSTPVDVSMNLLTDLPAAGGDVTSVDIVDESKIIAVIDGKICMVSSTGSPVVIESSNQYMNAMVGADGEIYALTYNDFWVIASPGATAVKTPLVIRNAQTLGVDLSMSPSGHPYLRVRSYPTNMVVYTSTDKGTTWTTVKLPEGLSYGGGLAFGAPGTMYLSTPTNFYATSNDGQSWVTSPAPLANYGGELIKRKNGDILYYVPNGGGLRVSHNEGATFTDVSPFNAYPFIVKMMEGDDGVLYATITRGGSVQPDKYAGLMKSVDGGSTWSHVYYAHGHDFDMRGSCIAVAHSNAVCGGVSISMDNGKTFDLHGMGKVQNITSFGFDSDNSLMLVADKALFRRTSAGWQCLGANASFLNIITTPQGNMYFASVSETYMTIDGGRNWSIVPMPDYISSGLGSLGTPATLGLANGEALVSITTYRGDIYPPVHTNGSLVRVRPNGTTERITSYTTGSFISLLQDASGQLYGSTDNFKSIARSQNNGATWTETTERTPGFAFDSRNKFIAHGELGTFDCGDLQSSTKRKLNLGGFTSLGNYITKAQFDRNDNLYLLTSDKGLFVATQKLP